MTIYDETLVPAYTLPDPLVDAHGVAIAQAAAWPARRAALRCTPGTGRAT